MSKQTTVFEGFFDQEPGWEFDMPCFMLRPSLGYAEVGSGPAGIEGLVEDWFISRWMKTDQSGKACGDDDEMTCQMDEDYLHMARMQFAYAKKGRARRGVFYWRQVIEWDDEDEKMNLTVMEDVCYSRDCKPLVRFGATTRTTTHPEEGEK